LLKLLLVVLLLLLAEAREASRPASTVVGDEDCEAAFTNVHSSSSLSCPNEALHADPTAPA
jgi:hypothetical protein